MDKASVVAFRDAILNEGKNRTLRVAFDNGIHLSAAADLIIWDDENERVIGFVTDSEAGAYASNLPIKMIASTYENIQFIMGNTNVNGLDEAIDSLNNACPISDDNKKIITDWFTKLHDSRRRLVHDNYLPIDIVRE